MANLKEAFEYASQNPDSAFAKNLEQLASSGSLDGEAKKYGIDLAPFKPEKTLGSKLVDRAKTVMDEVTGQPASSILTSADKTSGTDTALAGAEALTRTAQAPVRVAGAVGGAIGDVVGAGIEAAGLDKVIGEAVAPIAQSEPVQKATDVFKSLPQDTQDVLGAILNTANIPIGGAGVGVAKSGIESGLKTVAKGATTVAESPLVKGTVDITKMAGKSLARIPSRVATNVAEKQAQEVAIKSLPSKVAQTAVRDGVDITDVKNISSIKTTPETSKLVKTVQDFASGNTKTDPIEIVGKPIVDRVKLLNKEKEVIGKKLGDVAQNLGIITKPELTNGVFNALSSVPSLKGLQITPKGILDFSKTTLADATRIADRKEIQTIFKEATKWGDGLKAHNFRQSLFETLGGKKKSLANITDTVDNATNAVRKGISDVLETKNSEYKTLSNEYRKIVQPLQDLRKLMKNIDPNSSEDILNMSAGLLARRITSAASSNPQVKQLLTALDNAGTKGVVKINVTQLQDLYNVLNKYYDIAPKTGFQNLVKEGAQGGDSLAGMAKEALKNVAGQSNAVRQKALESLLKELGH